MINIPIVDDRLDLRVAGEWTKRDGYTLQCRSRTAPSMAAICGRAASRWAGSRSANLQTYLVWEHFSENDDRLRSGKQLCKTDPTPTTVDGVPSLEPEIAPRQTRWHMNPRSISVRAAGPHRFIRRTRSKCRTASRCLITSTRFNVPVMAGYGGRQQRHLRSLCQHDAIDAICASSNRRSTRTYNAKNDTLELNADYAVTPSLTFTSQTGYNNDFLWSTEDYNRFNTGPEHSLGRRDPGVGICTHVDAGSECGGHTLGDPCTPEQDISN